MCPWGRGLRSDFFDTASVIALNAQPQNEHCMSNVPLYNVPVNLESGCPGHLESLVTD